MKDYNYLSSELCKLGLNKKEADIYLILLNIGYCSVLKISEQTELSRPTVYRVLENLKSKNLINSVQKGKRNYFIAGSPDALLNMLRIEKRKAQEQEREFLRIINTLQDQYSFSANDNTIETYSDKKRTLALEKLTNTQAKKILIFSTETNSSIKKSMVEAKKRLGNSFALQQLYSQESELIQEKFVESKKFKPDITLENKNIIIANRVFIFEKNQIIVIKQKSVVESYKLLFESFWKNI